jgi:hypothetical protein
MSIPDDLSWTVIISFLSAHEAANLSSADTYLKKIVDNTMRDRLSNDDLGRILLRKHNGGEFSLAILAYCMEYVPDVGTYITMKQTNTRHQINDLYDTLAVQAAWVRCMFVIDGVVVLQRLEAHAAYTRFPVVRINLPTLVDLVEGSLRHPVDEHDRHAMEECWDEGMYPH